MNKLDYDFCGLSSLSIYPDEVLERTFDSIFVKSYPDFRALYINKEPTERMFGYSIESFYRGGFQCVHDEDIPLYQAMIDHCLTNGNASQRMRCNHKDGRIIWAFYKVQAMKDETGKIIAISGSCIDISELVAIEENMIKSSRQASQLQVSNGIAHEINNPLMIITGGIYRLRNIFKKENASESIFSLCDKIENSVRRIADIIEGLKSFTRDPGEEKLQDVQIRDLLTELSGYVSNRLEIGGVSLTISMNELEGLVVRIKKFQIVHAILNLIQNSIDAVESVKAKWIHLEVSQTYDFVTFSVTDSGTGVRENIVNLIMEPFFSTKEIGKGVGLGLSITRGIVEEHGGTLNFIANADHTKFQINIPKKKAPPK